MRRSWKIGIQNAFTRNWGKFSDLFHVILVWNPLEPKALKSLLTPPHNNPSVLECLRTRHGVFQSLCQKSSALVCSWISAPATCAGSFLDIKRMVAVEKTSGKTDMAGISFAEYLQTLCTSFKTHLRSCRSQAMSNCSCCQSGPGRLCSVLSWLKRIYSHLNHLQQIHMSNQKQPKVKHCVWPRKNTTLMQSSQSCCWK